MKQPEELVIIVKNNQGRYHASLIRKYGAQNTDPLLCTLQFHREGYASPGEARSAVTKKYAEDHKETP